MGTVTNQDESGTGQYDGGPVPGKVELKLEIQSGPSQPYEKPADPHESVSRLHYQAP